MSESDNQQDKLSDMQNETKTLNPKSSPTKKILSQTAQTNSNSDKTKIENAQNVADIQSTKKISIQSLMNVVTETKGLDPNLPEMVTSEANDRGSNDVAYKVNAFENKNKQSAEDPAKEYETEIKLTEVADDAEGRRKIRRQDLTEKELNEICGDRDGRSDWKSFTKTRTPGLDPRFQQQNQTLRCFIMYTDFYRCENILGKGEFACQWFKDVFTSICPLDWIRRWDEAREEGRFGWAKGKSQGKFPGNRYGV